MLTIGEFSRICFVSKKTLRHYDEIGLLRPQHTTANGYRYYAAGQLRTMLLIGRLKEYGLSLPEIAAVLAAPHTLAATLAEKRRLLAAELEHGRRIMARLDADVAKLERSIDIMDQDIKIKTAERPSEKLFGLRRKMDVRLFGQSIMELMGQAAQCGLEIAGPPMVFYHDESYEDPTSSDIEVAFPVHTDAEGENLRTLPGGLYCTTSLTGPYQPEEFKAAYAALSQWMEANGYHMNGSPFDVYVRGGEGVPPENFLSEIWFPIAK